MNEKAKRTEIAPKEKIARILKPLAWAKYDTLVGFFTRNVGADNYQETYGCMFRHGVRSGEDAKLWLMNSTEMHSYDLRESLAIAQQILDAGELRMSEWKPIESAPKGGGAEYVTDPNWVEPPKILMAFGDEGVAVVYWDWSYAEGGYYNRGQRDAWVLDNTAETSDLHFSCEPTHWMPLPIPPDEAKP